MLRCLQLRDQLIWSRNIIGKWREQIPRGSEESEMIGEVGVMWMDPYTLQK